MRAGECYPGIDYLPTEQLDQALWNDGLLLPLRYGTLEYSDLERARSTTLEFGEGSK